MNGRDDYEGCDAATRKMLLSKFNVLAQRFPIRCKTFCYRCSELDFLDRIRHLAAEGRLLPFRRYRGYDVIDKGEWHIEASDEQPSATLVYKIMKKSFG